MHNNNWLIILVRVCIKKQTMRKWPSGNRGSLRGIYSFLSRTSDFGCLLTSLSVSSVHVYILIVHVCVCVCVCVCNPPVPLFIWTLAVSGISALIGWWMSKQTFYWHVKLLFMDQSCNLALKELNMNKGLYLMSKISLENACVTGCVSDSSSSSSHPMGVPA